MADIAIPARAWPRPILTTLTLLTLLAAAVVGASPYGVRERLWHASESAGAEPVFKPWKDVVELQGDGSTAAAPFSIAADAVEWRVRWSCQSGHLLVEGAGPRPVIDAPCPGTGTGFATQTGPKTMRVTADGPWKLQVQQHIDPSHPGGSRM